MKKKEKEKKIFKLSKKEELRTAGRDPNLEIQRGLPITNDHIICSQRRG